MASVNKQFLVGVVGTINPIKGTTEMPVFTFSIATSDWVGKGKGDARNGEATDYKTTWHDIVTFGKTASSLEKRLGKGDTVHVDGSLSKEKYAKKDGTGEGLSVQTKANSVVIIHSKAGATGTTVVETATASVVDEDIPF